MGKYTITYMKGMGSCYTHSSNSAQLGNGPPVTKKRIQHLTIRGVAARSAKWSCFCPSKARNLVGAFTFPTFVAAKVGKTPYSGLGPIDFQHLGPNFSAVKNIAVFLGQPGMRK